MSEQRGEYKIEGRQATIFRVAKNKDNPYVMIDKRIIDNVELSFKAKGILVYLLSRPDGWEVNLMDLSNRSAEGLSAVKSGCKELKDAGYLKHAGKRQTNGRFESVIWEVHEVPEVENRLTDTKEDDFPSPQVDYPRAENPQVDNRIQVLKELSIKGNEGNIEKDTQNQTLADGYWQTILDQIRGDRTISPRHYAYLSNAVPISMTDHTLIIQIDEPEIYNARFSKTLERNIFHALVPGGKIVFQKG